MSERELSENAQSPALPLLVAALPALYDAYVFVGIRGGRDAFLARVGEPSLAFGLAGLVLFVVGVVVHVGLALRVMRAAPVVHALGHASPGNRRLQQASGAFLLLFIAARLPHSVFYAAVEGLGAAGLYERLRNDCDGYVFLALYVTGLAALSLHLGQGLRAIALRGRYAPEATRRLLGHAAVLFGVLCFVLLTDALSAYTLGAPLFSGR